jgi:hypothetical protein
VASEGEIEGGVDFEDRELGVKKKRKYEREEEYRGLRGGL